MIIKELSRELIEYSELGSTNEELNRLLGNNQEMDEGAVVRTDFQFSGKGYQGNTWSSEPGMNLLFSMLLKPLFLAPDKAFHLSQICSLSLVELLDNQGIKSEIKWPNDILSGSRKICGTLIENSILGKRLNHTILGIGLNVNQQVFDPGIPSPTSMCLEKGCHFDIHSLLGDFRNRFESWYQVLYSGNVGTIKQQYLDRLHLKGIRARFRAGKETIEGSIADVRDSGELIVEMESGVSSSFGFKEIEYLSGSGEK